MCTKLQHCSAWRTRRKHGPVTHLILSYLVHLKTLGCFHLKEKVALSYILSRVVSVNYVILHIQCTMTYNPGNIGLCVANTNDN